MKPKILLATTNNSKIRPFVMAWENLGLDKYYNLVDLTGLADSVDVEVEEDTGCFEKDALKKAKEYCQALGLPSISTDRGIEFDALGSWPGTKTKKAFAGSEKRILGLGNPEIDSKGNNLDIKRSQMVLDQVKGKNKSMKSVYGLAVVFPNGKSVSDLVVVNGRAAEELRITSVGSYYDWFFIPEGYDKTLSEFKKDEYFDFTSQVL